MENEPVFELPLVDVDGEPIELAAIVGSNRANMRFGKDSYGNLYLASKTDKKLYRLQGTPELKLQSVVSSIQVDDYFEFSLDRPPVDESIQYILEVSEDLALGFQSADSSDYEIVSVQLLENGKERVIFRYLHPIDSAIPRFFRFTW